MKPDIIFHLAGLVGTPRCQQDQELAINTNVMATNNIAEAYTPGQLIVYFGTTVMHDTQAPRPFHEETPIKAETLYGLTKYMGEEILTMKVRPEDLLIIRPCFVYGGKYDHASVITSMIRATLSNSPTLNIKVPLDPYNLKDYYYIDDFLSDLMLLIDNKARGVFNLSKGTPIHFGYVLDELYKRNLVPKGLKLLPKEDYLGDHHTTDKKARDIIGSTNKIEIGEGIDKIVEELQNDR
jgi:nucleoside-diphosphate-sugar epimerase